MVEEILNDFFQPKLVDLSRRCFLNTSHQVLNFVPCNSTEFKQEHNE